MLYNVYMTSMTYNLLNIKRPTWLCLVTKLRGFFYVHRLCDNVASSFLLFLKEIKKPSLGFGESANESLCHETHTYESLIVLKRTVYSVLGMFLLSVERQLKHYYPSDYTA